VDTQRGSVALITDEMVCNGMFKDADFSFRVKNSFEKLIFLLAEVLSVGSVV